jgi:hypothetical protein
VGWHVRRAMRSHPQQGQALSSGRGQSLRHDALQAELAGVPDDRGAIIVILIAQDDAEPTPAQQPHWAPLSVEEQQTISVACRAF